MIKVLFICHGNICRSTMAEYVMKALVNKSGLSDTFFIDSAATSREEIGNPVHYGTRHKLEEVGIYCGNDIMLHSSSSRGKIIEVSLSEWIENGGYGTPFQYAVRVSR